MGGSHTSCLLYISEHGFTTKGGDKAHLADLAELAKGRGAPLGVDGGDAGVRQHLKMIVGVGKQYPRILAGNRMMEWSTSGSTNIGLQTTTARL